MERKDGQPMDPIHILEATQASNHCHGYYYWVAQLAERFVGMILAQLLVALFVAENDVGFLSRSS